MKIVNNILFENIKTMRILLREGASQSSIIDAINNRKVITIFYAGEKTERKGYRTIQPHVLGVSKAGNLVLRAWQEAGDSDGFNGIGRKPRWDHEKFNHNGVLPGWRLFRVDAIKSFAPTGANFEVIKDSPKPKYNPNDLGMNSIIISAVPYENDDAKIKQIVINLYRTASQHLKEKTGDKIVVLKDGNYKIDFEKNRGKYQPNEILGNLKDLFVKYAGQKRDVLPANWHSDAIKKAKSEYVRSLKNKKNQPIE
jgi:hypothetical protein